MKNYKKVIALLMAASMTASLAACGGGTGDSQSGNSGNNGSGDSQSNNGGDDNNGGEDSNGGEDNQEPGGYTVITDADGNAIDLGGMEIIIGDWWSGDGTVAEPTSAYDEAQQAYRQWIQETYNFTISQQTITGWGEVFEDISDYVLSSGDDRNLVWTLRYAGELGEQMKNGLYYDLSTLDLIDMSAAKWDQGVKSFGTIGDKVYTMRRMDHEPRTGLYFNKRLLQENNIDPDEIYELQKNHQWTWDKFEEYLQMLTKDTDSDSVIDQYALLGGTELTKALVVSNRGNFVGRDADGNYTYELESQATMDALNKKIEWSTKYEYPQGDQNWDYFKEAFNAGKAVFLCQQWYAAGGDHKDMEDDFGFVAFPMGPNTSNYIDVMEDNIYVIPSCYDADRANKIAFAYSLYFAPVPEYEDYNDYYSNTMSNFRDMNVPEETIECMSEETYVMYHGFITNIDEQLNNNFLWQIGADNTPAAQAEVVRDAIKALIDQVNAGN